MQVLLNGEVAIQGGSLGFTSLTVRSAVKNAEAGMVSVCSR